MKFHCFMIIGLVFIAIVVFFPSANAEGNDEGEMPPLWNYTTPNDVRVSSLSADGRYIGVGAGDMFYLFDRANSTPLWDFKVTGVTDRVKSVALSDNGDLIVIGTERKKVHLFGKESSDPIWTFIAGENIACVDITADGEYIAVGALDNKVYYFDKDSSAPLWSYNTGNYIRWIAMSDDGEYVTVGNGRGKDTIYLFDKVFTNSQPLWSYETGDQVWSVDISADGEYIVAGNGADDGRVFVFDKSSSTPIWTKILGYSVRVAISDNGEYIAAACGDNNIYYFSRDDPDPLWTYAADDEMRYVDLSSDGEFIITGSMDDSVYFFNREFTDSSPLWTYTTDGDVWGFVSISDDGKFAAIPSYDDNVYLFHTNFAPEGNIDSISPEVSLVGHPVQFQGQGADPDGTIVDYYWESNLDGELSREANFSTSSLSIGTHRIDFTAQDNRGEWSEAVSGTVTIHARPNGTIESINPNPSLLSSNVDFKGIGEDDGWIIRYVWRSSRDGEIYNNTLDSFSYEKLSHGEHNISFRVQDNHLVWSNGSFMTVEVHTRPTSEIISISPNPALDTDTIHYETDEYDDGSIEEHHWRFVNESGFESFNGSASPESQTVGNYTVYYRVRDNHGIWSEVTSASLMVHGKPTAFIIETIPKEVTVDKNIHFIGKGSDDGFIVQYIWSSTIDGVFYNGSDSEFDYSNLSIGKHIISLKVKDNYGALSDEVFMEIEINDKKHFLLEEVGPLPILAYIVSGLFLTLVFIGIVISKRKKAALRPASQSQQSQQQWPSFQTQQTMTPTLPPQDQNNEHPVLQQQTQGPYQTEQQLPPGIPYQQQPQFPSVPPSQYQTPPIPPPQSQLSTPQPVQSRSFITVCSACGKTANANWTECLHCGAQMPRS